MKKIIFAALSVLMILSLVGCGEHIDYTPNKAFSTGDVAGVMNGWPVGNASNWTTADDDNYVYTYEFTALKEMGTAIQFKVRSTAGKWDTGDFGDAKLDTKGTKAELKSADFGGPAAEFEVEASHKYKITVTSEDGKVYGKVEDLGLDAVPVPFILNGMFVVGDDFNWGFNNVEFALMSFTKDLSGNVTYVKQFKAGPGNNEGKHNFRICQSNWKGGFGTGTVAVGGDALTLTACAADKEGPNVTVTGLTTGNVYQMTITTTPDEVVTVSITEICAVNVKLNIVGFPPEAEGMTAWVDGTFSGWTKGWPSAWKGSAKVSANPYTAEIAGGEATINIFTDKIADLGEVISIEGCGCYGKLVEDDIPSAAGDIKVNGNNFATSITVDGAATWIVTVDLENNTCTAAKQ